jgi:hypothetical protein
LQLERDGGGDGIQGSKWSSNGHMGCKKQTNNQPKKQNIKIIKIKMKVIIIINNNYN